MILSILHKDQIKNEKPIITLDVKLVIFKHPSTWPAALNGLAQLEYNYFELKNIELNVTPHIVTKRYNKMQSNFLLGFVVYKRILRNKFYNNRHSTTLRLTKQKANELWYKIRNILWASIDDNDLTLNQMLDNTQLFYHLIASGYSSNSAFLTIDNNFLNLSSELHSELGLSIMRPQHAWEKYQREFSLYIPDENDINWMWQNQRYHLGNFLYVLKNYNLMN